jgi:hypothetical protein
MHTTMNIIRPSEDYNNQEHVHEFEASTRLAEEGNERHNHRTAGVTGEAIPIGNGRHKHDFCSNTDFFVDHHHLVRSCTGPDISVGDGKHVHFVDTFTNVVENHKHRIQFATLIGPSPIT